MLKAVLLLTIIGCSKFAVAAVDPISNLEKGIICKAMEATYGDQMQAQPNIPVWLTCRETARFWRNGSFYAIIAQGSKAGLSCSAQIVSGASKTPVVRNLKCESFHIKPQN